MTNPKQCNWNDYFRQRQHRYRRDARIIKTRKPKCPRNFACNIYVIETAFSALLAQVV
jgi:hypothetical protein